MVLNPEEFDENLLKDPSIVSEIEDEIEVTDDEEVEVIDPTKKKKTNNPYTKSKNPYNINSKFGDGEIPKYAISKEQKEKKAALEKNRKIDPRHVDAVSANAYEIKNLLNDDEALKDPITGIGTDYSNWKYLLPKKYGGYAEDDSSYQKLLKHAKDVAWRNDTSLDKYYNVDMQEFEALFREEIENRANKQGADNIIKAVEATSTITHTQVDIKEAELLAQTAQFYKMKYDTAKNGKELTDRLRDVALKIQEYKTEKKEPPTELLAEYNKLSVNHQTFIQKFGDGTTVYLNFDGTPLVGAHAINNEKNIKVDVGSEIDLLSSLFNSILDEATNKDLTHGQIVSDALNTNLKNQIVWDKESTKTYNVTINDNLARDFIKKLQREGIKGIEKLGRNKNGQEYNITMRVLSRYYDELVLPTGGDMKGQYGHSPHGYFALTSNVKNQKEFPSSIWKLGGMADEAEFSGGPGGMDPNKAFKRKIKDFEEKRFKLLKEQAVLAKMDFFNVDPSSSHDYKGVKALDFRAYSRRVWNQIYDRKGQLNADLHYLLDSPNIEIDSMIEEVAYNHGLTLTDTMKVNMHKSWVYKLSEKAVDFLPVVAKFAVTDLLIKKTGIITGPLKLINYGRNFEKAGSYVATTEKFIERLLKANPTITRGSDDFAALMASEGYTIAKYRSNFAKGMEATLRIVVEEGKMQFVFGKDAKLGAGTAFLGVGSLFAKIFPNTLANSPAMLNFLGLGRSGTAGMISIQMAANLEAFIDDVRGKESYLTQMRDLYSDLEETGLDALADFFVFSAFGVRGVIGKVDSKMVNLRSVGRLEQLRESSKELAIGYKKKMNEDPDNYEAHEKQFKKYADLYKRTKERLGIIDFNTPKQVIETSTESIKKINENIKNKKEKITLTHEKDKPSSFKLKNGEPIININPKKGNKDITHEIGHYAIWKAGTNPESMYELQKAVEKVFPKLEASIIEAYGKINPETGKKELDKDLLPEEFLMHVVSKLTSSGAYNLHVANSTFKKVAHAFNRWYVAEYGEKPSFLPHEIFKESDLTTEQGVLDFLGNYAQTVDAKGLTAKYMDHFIKELSNQKYLTDINKELSLEEIAPIMKDNKVGEEIINNTKLAKELEDKVDSEIMKIYKNRIKVYGDPNNKDLYIEDKTLREKAQLEAIDTWFLSPNMRNNVRTPAPAESLAYWIAWKAKERYSNMNSKDIDIYASVVMKGTTKEGNKDRTITGIFENYIKYNTKDGGEKQDVSKTLIQQLLLRIPDIYKDAFPGREHNKNILDADFDQNKVETVEQREFDVIDPNKRMYEGNVKLGGVFDVTAPKAEEFVKKATYKDLSSANKINESVGPEILKQLKDKGYMSEKSQRILEENIREELLAENKLDKNPIDVTTDAGRKKFEKLVTKKYKADLYEAKYNYIFSKADMIYKALPKNIDLVTGESNFVMKTFGRFYTNTGQRLKTMDIFSTNTKGKKGEGPYGQVKTVISDPLSMKKAIMDVIFKPAPGGKPLTNSQIDVRIEQALKYVAYTISNQKVREALNNNDVRRAMEESNFPLINSIKIAQELTNIKKNARATLGDKTLFSLELSKENIEELGKIKVTENRAQWEENFTSEIYSLVDPAVLVDFVKANYSIEKVIENIGNDLYGSEKITILDQIPFGKIKDIDTEMISGKWVEAGNQWGYKDAKNLVTNRLGAQFRSKMRKSESYQEMIYDAHSVITGFLPEVLTNTLMHNKFMGSGHTIWETGTFQPKGVNSAGNSAWRTMNSDALKLWVKKSNIKPTTKETEEMLLELDFINKSMKPKEIKEIKDKTLREKAQLEAKETEETVDKVKKAFEIYTVTDNGKAKAYNLELLEQAVKEGKDLNDADVRLEIKEKFMKKWKLSEEVMEANDIILELYMRAGKKYYDKSKNKTVALNNLMFIFGEQTSIGGGPIRGLATHRSINFDIHAMRKGIQSEHALPVSGLSTNSIGYVINLKGPAFTKAIRELISIYKQDIIPREVQLNNDYKIVDGKKISTSQDFDAAIIRANSQSTWLDDFKQARYQVGLFSKYSSYAEKIATNKTIGNLVETLSTGAGISKKYSKNIGKEDLLHKLIKIEHAKYGIFTVKKSGSFFDLDDTLVFTKSLIKYTKPDGTKGALNAEQYAKSYESLTELGYKWDFTEFNEIKSPSLAPLFNKALKLQSKFGPEHMYIVTARPAQAAPAIEGYLKSKGLNIPLKNITGLGNSTAEAKGLFMAEKIGDGYNDIYFADDVLQNVQAVKNVVDQFDVKSKIQLARKKMALELSDEFNLIIEETSGVKKESVFSKGRAKVEGKNKGRFDFFMSPSAEDFGGLLYKFAGKGAAGEYHLRFLQENLITPFIKGTRDMDAARQSTTNDYNSLKKQHPKVIKLLRKKVPGSVYTHDVAIRVHRWTKAGYKVPEISKAEHKLLFEWVANNPELLEFSEKLGLVTKLVEGYTEPQADWLADTIVSDLSNMTEGVNRASMLHEWVNNRQAIFGEWGFERGKAILTGDNMNKIQAIHGSKFREALEDITYRMEFGKNMAGDASRIINNWNTWVNGSVGAIMFLNGRSAALQTLSTVNYLNWDFNNPFRAATALANGPQFIKDFAYIFNSDMLKQRRSGLKLDINEAALASAVNGKSNKPKAVIAYLLKKGFMPTQIADSFAIASGGATYYRNRIKQLTKDGVLLEDRISYDIKDVEAQAWLDFIDKTQTTQQSTSPYLISQQQASPLGKTVLSFNNTPMQYNRIMKKAFLDIVNGRGDIKTHISKIVYYGGIQNVVFHTLQSALFALTMDEEGDLEGQEEQKSMRVLNGMVDTILRGTGLPGAVLSTAKNALLEYYKQENKGWKADHTYTVLQAIKLSPSIGHKASSIYGATQGMKFNKGATEFMSPWAYNNPSLLAKAQVFEAVTNIPTGRIVKKTNNMAQAFNSENQKWQRVMLGAGWNKWDLGVKDLEVQDFNDMFREYMKNSSKSKRKSRSLN